MYQRIRKKVLQPIEHLDTFVVSLFWVEYISD